MAFFANFCPIEIDLSGSVFKDNFSFIFSDDPRLAVKKVHFCGQSGKLIVGGTAGQFVVCDLAKEAGDDADVPVIKSDLVTEKEGFVWKGHQPLLIRAGPFKMPLGFQPRAIVQISPPASINSLAFSESYGLVAAGTAHGLVIIDGIQHSLVMAKCTLSAQGDYFIRMHLITKHTRCLKITKIVSIWHFPPIFVLLKLTCPITLFWHF